jgi:thiamine pyrophosphokinase
MPALAHLRVLIAVGNEQTYVLHPGATLELRGEPGDTVSLIPFGGDAHGIVTDGLEYPLRDESLRFGPARGVSNVMLAERATVRFQSGLLLCVQAKREIGD